MGPRPGQSERPGARNLRGVLPDPLDSIPGGLSRSSLPGSHRLPHPAFPGPSHLVLRECAALLPSSSPSSLPPPSGSPWLSLLIKQVSLLPPTGRSVGPLGRPEEALWPEPSQMGARERERRSALCSPPELAARGLGVRNSFVQSFPFLCPSSCFPPSHCQRALSWF